MDTQTPLRDRHFDIARFKALYSVFNRDTLRQLSNIYSPDIVFQDPIHQLKGLDALSEYFANFCSEQLICEFDIHNEVVSTDQAFFQWTMRYQHPRLNSGKTLFLRGGTLIKFDSHILFHEDFYDMGAMIYQHIPVLGWAVRKINARMVQQPSENNQIPEPAHE